MKPSEAGRYLYATLKNGILELVIIVYVDDMLVISSYPDTLIKVKDVLQKKFKLTDLGVVKWFLGRNIAPKMNVIHVTQIKYIEKVSEWFNMTSTKSKPVNLPKRTYFQKSVYPDEK